MKAANFNVCKSRKSILLIFLFYLLNFTFFTGYTQPNFGTGSGRQPGAGTGNMPNANLSASIKNMEYFTKLTIPWNMYEPQRDEYDPLLCWDCYVYTYHYKIRERIRQGKYLVIELNTAVDIPYWLFNSPDNVEKVVSRDQDGNQRTFPDYRNNNYVARIYKLFNSLFKTINDTFYGDEKYITGIKLDLGVHNLYKAYLEEYVSGSQEAFDYFEDINNWIAYTKKIYKSIEVIKNSYANTGHIGIFINCGPYDLPQAEKTYTWFNDNLQKPWFSTSFLTHGYALNNDKTAFSWLGKDILWRKKNNETPLPYTYSDYSWDSDKYNLYKQYIVWNIYWQCLYNLHWGGHFLDLENSLIEYGNENVHKQVLEFYNFYAGQKEKLDAPGAFCALRDGLDAADTQRFPTNKYGKLSDRIGRAEKIRRQFSDKGCIQGDPNLIYADSQTVHYGNYYSPQLNDIGWDTYSRPYRMNLRLLNETDGIGYWQVGYPSQPYGRYAMGINKNNKNKLFFDLNDKIFSNGALKAKKEVQFRVTYFDKGKGKFKLFYDAKKNKNKNIMTIKKTNSKIWKTVKSGWIKDAYFGNRANSKSDLYLMNPDNDIDIIHMVDIRFSSQKPQPPQRLRVSSREYKINLSWLENQEDNISYYKIYKKVGTDGVYKLLGTSVRNAYTDTDVEIRTRYFYRISAVNDNEQESNLSDEKYGESRYHSVYPPENLTAEIRGKCVYLEWDQHSNMSSITYIVFRRNHGSTAIDKYIYLSRRESSYLDCSVGTGTYDYTVAALSWGEYPSLECPPVTVTVSGIEEAYRIAPSGDITICADNNGYYCEFPCELQIRGYPENLAQQALLQFRSNGIKTDIISAKLYLYTENLKAPVTLAVVENWQINYTAWNRKPEIIEIVGTINNGNKWLVFDVTGHVLPNKIHSFALMSDSEEVISFSSSQGQNPPVLEYELAP